jgi:hypothetical protein
MTMNDEKNDPVWDQVRETYNVPPDTPRADMWSVISERIGEPGAERGVIDISDRRIRLAEEAAVRSSRASGWAVAAAAVLVLGIGIGRMTAPAGVTTGTLTASGMVPADASIALAAREHLGRTESLLTMVRADARDGRVDPATAGWASELLTQTRLLIDAQRGDDPAVNDLLLDLELILIQIAGAAETGSIDEARARTELELTLRSLEEGEVLPRIQAVLPVGMAGA